MSITIDTNIYVSALNFGSQAALRLLALADKRMLTIDISAHIEEELVRVLRQDFGWDGYRLHFMVGRLRNLTNRVTPTDNVHVVDDPDDNKIIECALAGNSDFIVTNDNALLRIGSYGGIKILRLADYSPAMS